MYGLKQDACLAFDDLVKLLSPHGYFLVQESHGLLNRHTHSIVVALCVEIFCCKYNSMEDAHHLTNAIRNISNPRSIGKVKITSV